MNNDLKEKAELFTGSDNWCCKADDALGIRPVRFSDGPSGLRIETKKGIGFNPSKPAVAWPSASVLACSFNQELLRSVGTHLSQECRAEGIDVLLAPGVNHKRSPLCGRNFEYYSEDPVLSGKLGGSFIKGLQENGTGACLKHLACNSRELGRMVQDSVVDERALWELYLRQFEIALKEGHPWSLMAAYNRLNGVYCCENKWLLQDVVRKKWKYDGLIISDWGGVADPVSSIRAGLDLEMPGGENGAPARIASAAEKGKLSYEAVDEAALHLKKLSDSCDRKRQAYNLQEHLQYAQKAAEESAVLLKNDDHVLPLKKKETIALIGSLCERMVFEGEGSSHVNPIALDSICSAMREEHMEYVYVRGYSENRKEQETLVKEALKAAQSCDKAVIAAGLPAGSESEGYDRENMDLPEYMNHLIEAVAEVNPDTIVVLQCGSPVKMPWRNSVKGILWMGLGGCQAGKACCRLLCGSANPCGKLAETWPASLSDNPSFHDFPGSLLQVQYRESIFSGYRYYDKAGITPAYPFGYGLSYTTFAYSRLEVRKEKDCVIVSVDVENTGSRSGREVVQIYAGMKQSRIERPARELKAFESVFLEAGEKKTLTWNIEISDFSYYDVLQHDWSLEEGTYVISAASSSREIRLEKTIHLDGNRNPFSRIPAGYLHLENGSLSISESAFEEVLGRTIDKNVKRRLGPDTSIDEMGQTRIGRWIQHVVHRIMSSGKMNGVSESMVTGSPVRMLLMLDQRISWDTVDGAVDIIRGHPVKGIRAIRRSLKRKEQ